MVNRLEAYGQMLAQDPLGFVIFLVTFALAVLISLILHEVAHGYVAWKCGDPTAKMMGRLSLNPLHHLDPVGTICMVLLGFGWAKPVPVNPRFFRRGRRDDFLVSIAGIVTNLTLFLLCSVLGVLTMNWMVGSDFALNVRFGVGDVRLLQMSNPATRLDLYDFLMGYLLDGSAVSELSRFLAVPWLQHLLRFLMLMSRINISLAIFNLLPIPPLDGYHLVNDTLLKGRLQLTAQTFRIAQVALLLLCWTGALTGFLSTVVDGVSNGVLTLFLQLIP